MRLWAPEARRLQLSFWSGIVLVSVALAYLAKARASWPWFSLWLFTLLAWLAALQLPSVRRALSFSWFKLTFFTLTGVALFNVFLFHVETHRHRSERLEIRGVYFDAARDRIRVGAGWPGLDARLEGSLYDFDRWSVDLERVEGNRFRIDSVRHVDMLRVRDPGWGRHLGARTIPALGAELDGRRSVVAGRGTGPDSVRVSLDRTGRRGTLRWGDASAPLALDREVLDRRLSTRMARGIPLAELPWDSLPDRAVAEDLVLTRVSPGRALGRLRLSLPRYRIVSRSDGGGWGEAPPPSLAAGDTVWVTSRGKTWAFAVGLVTGLSRVAPPASVTFVRRPRPTGWALPSPEACGREAHRCAVLSSRPLPPPQAHFDLSGSGLDTARYSILARLETTADGARLVGAREVTQLPYGEVRPVPALALGDDPQDTGILVRVSRSSRGRQSDVLLTVAGLYLLVLAGLFVVSGDRRLWRVRHGTSPHVVAAWGLLNVFLVFLGIRLALGLRVAFTPPFYDRAASTAVGLWIAFAVLLVTLGRWSSWSPRFWKLIRRLERPLSRLFIPGRNGNGGSQAPSTKFTLLPADSEAPEEVIRGKKARRRTAYGLILFVPTLAGLLWQRPEAALGLPAALAVLAAWLAMGMARRRSAHWPLSSYPLRVVTADAEVEKPALAFALAAGASVVLALAMHAPLLALVPVLGLLFLFGVNHASGRGAWAAAPERRGWLLLAIVYLALLLGVVAFAAHPVSLGVGMTAMFAAAGLWVRRPGVGDGSTATRLESLHGAFSDLSRAVLSGLGWVGVLVVLGTLIFLSTQEIPPFARFALVFVLFLLAIRAGLACHRVLMQGHRRGYLEGLGLLVIPLGVLLVFMLFDFGLGLVFFVPMFVTVLLSARIDRLPVPVVLGSVGVAGVLVLVAWSVLRPSLRDLRTAPDVLTFAAEYEEVGNALVDGLRAAGLAGPITRATVRSIAASEPGLLEEALAFAGPSDALFAAAPSLEQVWGGRAYAASDWTGTGFAGTTVLGRGIPTAVSYAENTFSVYVLSEHGALGGLAVLLAYLALLAVVGLWIVRVHGDIQESPLGLAVLAMTVGGVLWLTLPAVYVAASNLALVPLTGQNMPFLGLNSWADVVLVAGLSTGMLFALTSLDATDEEALS
jgi:hypothetical protein